MPQNVRVMGFGTFDGIHKGHEFYLKQLRDLGSDVIVVVARDSNVKRFKGRFPKHSQKQRIAALKATGLADQVILGHPTDFYQCLIDYQPDVVGLGYDQKADLSKLQADFPSIDIVRLPAFEPTTYKSSLLNQ